uniref:Uncharacterized protein n=1 Tax=Peronospora matthiolae TaxID=2874970 RepID=A0AAV1TRU0_9STRA
MRNEETTLTNRLYGLEDCEGQKRDAGVEKMTGGELFSQGWKGNGFAVSTTTLRTAAWRDGDTIVIEIAGVEEGCDWSRRLNGCEHGYGDGAQVLISNVERCWAWVVQAALGVSG